VVKRCGQNSQNKVLLFPVFFSGVMAEAFNFNHYENAFLHLSPTPENPIRKTAFQSSIAAFMLA
jgi:hypothetical protein